MLRNHHLAPRRKSASAGSVAVVVTKASERNSQESPFQNMKPATSSSSCMAAAAASPYCFSKAEMEATGGGRRGTGTPKVLLSFQFIKNKLRESSQRKKESQGSRVHRFFGGGGGDGDYRDEDLTSYSMTEESADAGCDIIEDIFVAPFDRPGCSILSSLSSLQAQAQQQQSHKGRRKSWSSSITTATSPAVSFTVNEVTTLGVVERREEDNNTYDYGVVVVSPKFNKAVVAPPAAAAAESTTASTAESVVVPTFRRPAQRRYSASAVAERCNNLKIRATTSTTTTTTATTFCDSKKPRSDRRGSVCGSPSQLQRSPSSLLLLPSIDEEASPLLQALQHGGTMDKLNQAHEEFLSLDERIRCSDYNNDDNDDENTDGPSTLEIYLQAATKLVDIFLLVQEVLMLKGTRQDTTTFITMWFLLESNLYNRLSEFYLMSSSCSSDASLSSCSFGISSRRGQIDPALSPGNAAALLTWIHAAMGTWKARGIRYVSVWDRDCKALLQHYLQEAVEKQVRATVQRSLDQVLTVEDIRQERSGGAMVTNLPSEVAYMFHVQLQVAKQCLPAVYQEHVVRAANAELQKYVADMIIAVSTHWKDMRTARFCAILNDAVKLADQCEERNQEYLLQPDAVDAGNILVTDLVQLSLHVLNYLPQRMIHDLCAPDIALFSRVGTREWEEASAKCQESTGPTTTDNDNNKSIANIKRNLPMDSLGRRLIITYQDFLTDIEKWIADRDYYFPKLLQHCLDATMQTYLSNFFSNTLAGGVHSSTAASQALLQDYKALKLYFVADPVVSKYHGVAGFASPKAIASQLRVLHHMAMIMEPTWRPDELQDDVEAILRHFSSCAGGTNNNNNHKNGDTGNATAVLLHLAGLRHASSAGLNFRALSVRRQQREEAVEWLHVLSSAKQQIQEDSKEYYEVVAPPQQQHSYRSRYMNRRMDTDDDRSIQTGVETDCDQDTASLLPPLVLIRRKGSTMTGNHNNNKNSNNNTGCVGAGKPLSLPDIRNSKFVQNVRPSRADLHRLSARSRHNMSVRKLLNLPSE